LVAGGKKRPGVGYHHGNGKKEQMQRNKKGEIEGYDGGGAEIGEEEKKYQARFSWVGSLIINGIRVS